MQYPEINFKHLCRMSDSTGLYQHARWAVPDPNHGYTLDDNVRALMAALMWQERDPKDTVPLDLAYRYLAFMLGSQHEDGRFRNFMGFDRRWLEDVGSDDSHGRALWALGFCIRHATEPSLIRTATWMFDRAAHNTLQYTSPRTIAFALHGFADVALAKQPVGNSFENMVSCAKKLSNMFRNNARHKWQWFEYSLTYANATFPQALLVAAQACDFRGEIQLSAEFRDVGKRSLDFLVDLLFNQDRLDLIGQNGWYAEGGQKAVFDQQPVDAQCMVEALLCAHKVLGEDHYRERAQNALEWFYGRNRHNLSVYDSHTGGCFDGLTAEGVNENEGAESTLAHLLARMAWDSHK